MNGRAEVSRLRKRLDATFGRMPTSSSDLEVQADFAKYLCVLVSGFFENAIVALILYYVEQRSSGEVASFVERQLDRWTNPNVEKIATLFGSFNSGWRDQLNAYFVDQRKDSVNSLIALRHQIAHGESVGTSLSQVKAHYATILQVVEYIADLVDPQSA
jgi:RiboL-PSP-HEPN